MPKIKALHATVLLLFLILLFHISKASSKPAGFSLKLIRAYSPMYSLSHRNNTFRERYKSYVHASKARASYWTSFNKSTANKTIHPDVIRPPLTKEGETIVVVMRIGTPAQQVFLVFDTGSLSSWTQCASCTTCFPQSTTMFDPQLSTAYHEMSSDDPKSKPPIYTRNEQKCRYKLKYIAGQYSNGIGSYDTFASMDNNPGQIYFGCSLEAAGFIFPPDTIISGILGMSRTKDSLPSQLSQYGGKGRFSYCLVDVNTAPSVINWVTFGDDIPYSPDEYLFTFPFIHHHRYSHAWAINLLDISVGIERLNLPPGTFSQNSDGGNGGLILDTGSKFTFLTRDAYIGIKSKIQNHFSKSEDFTDISDRSDICYRYNGSPGQLPIDHLQTVTFHLEDEAYLYMPVTSVYLFNLEDNTFCLGILGANSKWPNILGSLQQQDTRFVYDLNENSLFFNPDTCAD